MNLADLRKPFDPAKISWRVGSTTKDKTKGMALAYIDARDVQDRLDEVCGVARWQCRYPHVGAKTVCEIGIIVPTNLDEKSGKPISEWIWKSDGAGDSDIEAEKGALSDAFKRAAVRWGVGRYLYDLDSPWVEVDTYEKGGQVYVKGIKAGELKRLEALLAGTKLKAETRDEKGTKLDAARNWANEAMREIKALPADALVEWADANSAKLVKLRAVDPDVHLQLMKALQA
jgi:hypothetical protein